MQRETRTAHYVVSMLTTLSLVLLSLPLSAPVRSFKTWASYVFDPLSYEGERGYQKLAEAPPRVRELVSADIENRRLREELRATSWLKTTVESLSIENDRLRRELGLKTSAVRYPLWAHVVERDPLHWYNSVSIDAGEDRGVSLNDAVLGRRDDAVVAVGRVVEVRPQAATVLLLTDERSAVAAYLSSGTLEGLVQGQSPSSARLLMNYIGSEARVFPGDSVYTSANSATFPPDVLVGRVAKINPQDPFLGFQAVEISPALDAASLQEVLILRARASVSAQGPSPRPRRRPVLNISPTPVVDGPVSIPPTIITSTITPAQVLDVIRPSSAASATEGSGATPSTPGPKDPGLGASRDDRP